MKNETTIDFEAVVEKAAEMAQRHGFFGGWCKAVDYARGNRRGSDARVFWFEVAASINDVRAQGGE